jgi:hypothetical protein
VRTALGKTEKKAKLVLGTPRSTLLCKARPQADNPF